MAKGTPNIFAANAYHAYWGRYSSSTALPNASGNPLANPEFAKLEPGDTAYDETGQVLWTCRSAGTVSGGNAVWLSGGKNVHAECIVVGNALYGDTAAVCDYLDVGDGVQLQAALTAAAAFAAGPGLVGSVELRAGTITTATPINVPSYVQLRGQGVDTTAVVGNGLNRTAMVLQLGATLQDIQLGNFTLPAVGCSGTEVLRFDSSSTLINVYVSLFASPYTPTLATRETLTALARTVVGASNFQTLNLYGYSALSFVEQGVAREFIGFDCNSQVPTSQMTGTFVFGTDVAFNLQNFIVASNLSTWFVRKDALRIDGSALVVSGGQLRLNANVTTDVLRGLVIGASANLCQVSASFSSHGADGGAASTGVTVTAGATNTILNGCSFSGFRTGRNGAVGATNTIVNGCLFTGYATAGSFLDPSTEVAATIG